MIEKSKLMFKDQLDAASKLYDVLLLSDSIDKQTVFVCSSLASIILTDFIAKKIKVSYELLFSEKISAPANKQCTVAMVSEDENIVCVDELIDSFGISYDYIYGEGHRKYEEGILKNVYRYRKGKLIESLKGKNIVLIDEGCETGLTALVCIKTLISLGAKSISYATPMIAFDVLKSLKTKFDQIYTVNTIADFVEVDFYYENKIEFDSDHIITLLEESPYYLPLQKQGAKVCNIQ